MSIQTKKEFGVTKSALVPFPVDKPYDYAVGEMINDVEEGAYACVPLGQREVPAVVWGQGAGDIDLKKVKSMLSVYDLPPLPEVHRRFLNWMAHYTMAPLGSILKLTLSVPGALEPSKPVTGYVMAQDFEESQGLSPKAQAVLNVAKDGLPRRASELAEEAGCSAGVVKTLHEKGFLKTIELQTPPPCRVPDPMRAGAMLSSAQQEAASALQQHVKDNSFSVSLLDGVTGAGKTEVYFEAVAEALKANKQVLILLPEIALSNAFLERFKARFGCAPALWHSSLSPAKRKVTWRGVAQGQSKVIIGARSALFLPYQDLGLIIVDEEHDAAYKQEEGVIYHARDMAIVRAKMGGIPTVLVSATPSLETMHNVWEEKYNHYLLPSRFGGAQMPDIHLINLKEDKPENRQHFIAPSLQKALSETLEKKEQSLLFLNRRGYAPLTLCRTCGHRFECPRCTAWLIDHRRSNRLQCHHCGYSMPMPRECPSCEDKDSLAACGPGVERIKDEIEALFPEARICILSSDTADTHEKLRTLLDRIQGGEIDIIIGTQIIAKGHHFPQLTCVGVIDADLGLSGGDLRATERTFQLLHQVAGRAGREKTKGHVYLQTYNPESRVIQALISGERDQFLAAEQAERQEAFMPPFSRLAALIISGRDEQKVQETALLLAQNAPRADNLDVFGPAEALMYRLRGKYRRRLLVRSAKNIDLQKAIKHWIKALKIPSTVRVQVDIDPQSFY
ncbi:MAG: primosomal protein N' [Pseudomonadota bacterium]